MFATLTFLTLKFFDLNDQWSSMIIGIKLSCLTCSEPYIAGGGGSAKTRREMPLSMSFSIYILIVVGHDDKWTTENTTYLQQLHHEVHSLAIHQKILVLGPKPVGEKMTNKMNTWFLQVNEKWNTLMKNVCAQFLINWHIKFSYVYPKALIQI